MGLDCTAYSKVRVIPPSTDEDHECYETCQETFAYPGFEQSTRGLPNHDVQVELFSGGPQVIAVNHVDVSESESYGWRAGSYGGYGAWRRELAGMAGYTPEGAWADPEPYMDKPFFELVNFADNEGTIGWDAAADLLADFIAFRGRYEEDVAPVDESLHGYAMELYDEWVTALTLAADHGIVQFH